MLELVQVWPDSFTVLPQQNVFGTKTEIVMVKTENKTKVVTLKTKTVKTLPREFSRQDGASRLHIIAICT